MKVRFFYYWSQGGRNMNGRVPNLWDGMGILDISEEQAYPYQKYLLSALSTNFPTHHPEWIDEVLSEIEKLEHGEIDVAYWGGDPGFEQTITREEVAFEHGTFGECPEWPLWTCSLVQYKAALKGWRQFIGMPKSIDTELIIDLPD